MYIHLQTFYSLLLYQQSDSLGRFLLGCVHTIPFPVIELHVNAVLHVGTVGEMILRQFIIHVVWRTCLIMYLFNICSVTITRHLLQISHKILFPTPHTHLRKWSTRFLLQYTFARVIYRKRVIMWSLSRLLFFAPMAFLVTLKGKSVQ